jgi:hypothetical protein
MTGQRFYPVFTMVKSLSAKAKRDSSEKTYIPLLLLVLCAVSSCVSEGHIGGRSFPLKITTTVNSQPQPGATVYVIPYDKWLASKMTLDNPKCRDYLEQNWKVTDGKTPVTIYYASYRLVTRSCLTKFHAQGLSKGGGRFILRP